MFRVLVHIDRLAVVLYGEHLRRAGDLDMLDRVGRLPLLEADDVIVGVDQQLIHELVEAGIHRDLVCRERVSLTKEDILLCSLNRADVRIGQREDVLPMGLLAVGGRECHVAGKMGGRIQKDFVFIP